MSECSHSAADGTTDAAASTELADYFGDASKLTQEEKFLKQYGPNLSPCCLKTVKLVVAALSAVVDRYHFA